MDNLLKSKGKKPRNGVVKSCDECATTFYAPPCRAESARFCSKSCRNINVTRDGTKYCLHCKKPFSKNGRKGRFCSSACYYEQRKPLNNCKTCHASLPTGRSTYCSRECYAMARYTRIKKVCGHCGHDFDCEKKESDRKYCSWTCSNLGRRLKGPGAKTLRQDGYISVYFPAHPDAGSNKMVLEHRLVMEEMVGRRILKTEHVHHKNGVRTDNSPENLELISASDHARISNKQGMAQRKAIRDELAEYKRRFGPLTDQEN